MDYYKIGRVQAICLVLIVMANHLILNVPKNAFLVSGNSALLNTIYIIGIAFIFLFLILKLFKNFKGQDILDISHFLGGNGLKTVVGIIYFVFFAFIGGLLLRNFLEGLKEIYFPQSPIYLLLILVLFVGVVANKFGGNTVIKYNSIIVPLMLVSLLIILFASFPTYIPEKVFPLLGLGVNETFLSGATNLYAFSGFSFLFFMMPLLKDSKDFKLVGITSITISSIFLFLSILTLLFSFSSVISIYELSPIYLVLRAADFGRFFQRPDAIFILFWLLSMMAFVNIIIMFCCINFKKITRIKNPKMMIYSITTFIFILALLPKNLAQIRWFQENIYKYSVIVLVFILTPALLFLANLKYKKLHKNDSLEVIRKDEKMV